MNPLTDATIPRSIEGWHLLGFTLALLAVPAIVAAGLQPSIDIGGNLGWMAVGGGIGGDGGGGTANFCRVSIGTMVPIWRCVGFYARLADLTLWPELRTDHTVEICSRFGAVEMIDGDHISPYFKQGIVFRHGYYLEELAITLDLGIGAEFMREWRLSPFVECGAFGWAKRYDESGGFKLDLSYGGGVRLKLGKTRHENADLDN